jgi:hypothetical protein
VHIDFKSLNIKGKAIIRDLWQKKDLGSFKNKYQQMINGHGAAMFRIGEAM